MTSLASVLSPFVLLEVGNARVTPFVKRDMTSFVHEVLERSGQLNAFADNRPRGVRCVHPLVTLLEKLDALMRRQPRAEVVPATFVRHFEDAARIVQAMASLPPLTTHANVRALAHELLEKKQIAALPSSMHAAFIPTIGQRWTDIGKAHEAIRPMFWGERLTLEAACAEVRGWLVSEFR